MAGRRSLRARAGWGSEAHELRAGRAPGGNETPSCNVYGERDSIRMEEIPTLRVRIPSIVLRTSCRYCVWR